MVLKGTKKEKHTIIRSDGEKIEKLEFKVKGNNDLEKEKLEKELYNKVDLSIYAYEIVYDIKFSDDFSKPLLTKILTKQILNGYKSIKNINELKEIAKDIIGKIFIILDNNNIPNPTMNDIMRIIDNMRISTIESDAKYYYETIMRKEKKNK